MPSLLFLYGDDDPAQALDGLCVLGGGVAAAAPPQAHVVEGLANHLVLPADLHHRAGLLDDTRRGHVLGTSHDLELRPPFGWVRVPHETDGGAVQGAPQRESMGEEPRERERA